MWYVSIAIKNLNMKKRKMNKIESKINFYKENLSYFDNTMDKYKYL